MCNSGSPHSQAIGEVLQLHEKNIEKGSVGRKY